MKWILLLIVLVLPATAVAADIWPALEKIEDTRLLFHSAMWHVHNARALALAVAADPITKPATGQAMQTSYGRFGLPKSLLELDDLTKEGLWLYEILMSLDEAGQSLCSYRDAGTPPYLDDDIRMLEQQTAAAAGKVLAFHGKTRRAYQARLDALTAAFNGAVPPLRESRPIPWPDAKREWGRQNGISIGWPMLLRPYPESAQAQLDKAHGLGPAYVLAKAKKVGAGHIFVLDPQATAWRSCEPQQGKYDFAMLDAILTEIRAAGLKAIVFIPSLTTACPDWLAGSPEERSFVASDGTTRSGVFQFIDQRRGRDSFSMVQDAGRDNADECVNLHNPAVRAAFLSYLRALGGHIKQQWADTLMGAQLETNCIFFLTRTKNVPSTDVDYSRFARDHWRQWLRTLYGEPGKLAAAWGANIDAWEKIDLPRPITFENTPVAFHGCGGLSITADSQKYIAGLPPRQWHDFLDWRGDYIVEYFRVQADALRQSMPGVPLLIDVKDFDGHIPLLDRPEFSWDAAKLSSSVADLPQHTGSAEWADSLLLAYARQGNPESPAWIANQGEKTFGALITQSITGPYYKDAIILNHRFGPGEVMRYFHDIGAYNYLDQQLNTDGANSWFLAAREDQAVAPEILNTRVARGQIAVLWPESSFRYDPDTSALREAECWADALHCLGYSYDYIFERHLTAAGLAGCKALVLPAAWCLSDAACAAIRQFVEAGGVLIATSAPGQRDELGRLRPQWALADLLGVAAARFIPIAPVVATPLGIVQPEGWWEMDGIRQKEGDLTYAGRLSCTYDLPDANRPATKVIGKYPDGSPAIILRDAANGGAGKGKVLLLGYPFGSEYGWSNYNEIGFGKIHGDTANLRWQRELEAWLRGQMRSLGLRPVHEPGKAITLRPNGREIEAPTLGYPQGGSTWENYMLNVNDPDRTIEFTLREREGIDTKYLCVWNREGQYGASRGYVHHFAGPKYLTVTVNIPGIKAIYDVSLRAPVRFEKQGDAAVFRTCLAPCMGRVFAISTAETVTLFAGERTRGIQDAELSARVQAIAKAAKDPADVLVVHEPEIKAFLKSLKGKTVRIGCGSPAYQEVGDKLAAELKKRLGCEAQCTLAGVQYSADRWRNRFPAYTAQDVPDILLGNEWDNQLLASFSATPWVSGKPQMLFLPLIVNKALPGPGRGVLQLSRPYQVIGRQQRKADEPAFYRFDPVPQRLVIGGSDVAGTEAALKKCVKMMP